MKKVYDTYRFICYNKKDEEWLSGLIPTRGKQFQILFAHVQR